MARLRFASLFVVAMITSGCGLALEPRFFKEAGLHTEASSSIDGESSADASTSDGAVIVQDRVVPAEDAIVIGADSGTTGDATAVRDVIIEPVLDATVLDALPLDVITRADSGVVTDTGVVDSGVRADAGVFADSGRVDGGVRDGGDGGSGTCPVGRLFCSGMCVASDETNCGTCGRSCAVGLVCIGGMCTSCPLGQTVCGDLNGNRCCASACGAGLVCMAVD
ncbi:MAG: hypothetical protein U0269_14795 [Polyangiales bacterium]